MPKILAHILQGLIFMLFEQGPQSQFSYCSWYRSSHGPDLDDFEIALSKVQVVIASGREAWPSQGGA